MAHLVLYDGLCGLCNRSVNFILHHDRHEAFMFASMQSDISRQILAKHGNSPDSLDTLILINDFDTAAESVMTRSDAALFVMSELRGWYRVFDILRVLPKWIRDRAYNLIARNRYGWFGKYDACPLPDVRYRGRFIDR
jgi:predicted DCC family thiol-disulfide oxidoreductase YuxK